MIESIVFFGLLFALGYLLGIVGFFQAGSARAEVRELRAALAREIARRTSEGDAQGTRVSPPAAPMYVPPPPPSTVARQTPETDAAETDAKVEHSNEPQSAPPPPPPPPTKPAAKPTVDVEGLLTMRWAVWLGAVALLFAGAFLIRYASEQGLLGPAPRCGAALLLGCALLAAAEWAQRRPAPVLEGPFAIDQVPAALAAGGIAILFGAAYGAGPFYGLLPPVVAFGGMAAASFFGVAAALRFGPLTAAVGIVGAFVSPALVTTASPSLVGLFVYLTIATAGAQAAVRRTAWTWLGWAVTIAASLWVLIAAGMPHDPGIWAAAVFVVVVAALGLVLPSEALDLRRGRLLAWGQFATIATAGLVLEAVAPIDATRLAVLALTPLAIWRGMTSPQLDRLPWLAAAFGLAAFFAWEGVDGTQSLETFPIPGDDMLLAAALFAATHAGTGLLFEARAVRGIRWTALVAAVPVFTLALCYADVGRFETDVRWGLCALVLATALTMTTGRAMRQHALDRAGAHAAGAIAALALGFGMTLRDHWLVASLALIVPGLAWIEGRTSLSALRRVATVLTVAVSVLSFVALVQDIGYAHLVASGRPLLAYALPAAAFLAAAIVFRQRSDDTLVALLEANAAAAFALFVTIEIRLCFGNGRLDTLYGFDEVTTLMLAMAAQAIVYDRVIRRSPRATLNVARNILGGIALVFSIGLLFANPMLTNAKVGPASLAFAYLVPTLVAVLVIRSTTEPAFRMIAERYAPLPAFAWLTLQVRYFFHPETMSVVTSPVSENELWCWSGAWLVYGIVLMVLGVRLANRDLRLAALALVGLVTAKVFLVDMAELTGLWRVASFLGLGLTLIGLGAIRRRFVAS